MNSITITLPEPMTIGLGIEYFGTVLVEADIHVDGIWIIADVISDQTSHLSKIPADVRDPNLVSLVAAMWQAQKTAATRIIANLPDPRLQTSVRWFPFGHNEIDPQVIIHEVSFTARVRSDVTNYLGQPGTWAGKPVGMNLRPSVSANWRAIVRGLYDSTVSSYIDHREQGGKTYAAAV